MHRKAVEGTDGLARCPWSVSAADYVAYHDEEWGRPVRTDAGLFERLCLEGFQSGLAWLTILRKREAFRAAFDDFAPERVAEYSQQRVEELLGDSGIVRNRRKVEATVANARAAVSLPAGLSALVWSYAPDPGPAPADMDEVPAATGESRALAGELKRHGFRFVGPTTTYAMMQACGLVNDHLAGCFRR